MKQKSFLLKNLKNWGMNFMNEKQIFINNLNNHITGDSLNLLEKNQLLLKTILLLFSKDEQDADIWQEIINLSCLITEEKQPPRQHDEQKKYIMWEMNCENIKQNEEEEKKYDSLNNIEKKIFSYRVLCPKSSDYNFNPFF